MSFAKPRRLLVAALALSLAVATTGRAQPTETAGGNALALVPAKAPIVIQLRGWDRSVERLKAFIKAAVGDFSPTIIGQIESGISQALEGRELKGVAKDGPIFLVFTEMPTPDKDKPDVAVLVRVENYVQFRDAFLKEAERKELKAEKEGVEVTKIEDQKTYLLNRDGFAVVTASEKSLKVFQDKKVGSLGGLLAKPLAAKLTENDAAIYVDMKSVNKQYGDQIAQGRQFMDLALMQAQGMGNVGKEQIEQAKKVFEALFQFVEDCDTLVAGVDFRPEGALLRLHAQVGEKSKTNTMLVGTKSAALTGIAKLPAGQLSYTGSVGGLDTSAGLINSMLGLGAGGGDTKANKAMEEATAELAKLKVDETSGSIDYPMTGISVTKYSDATKAVAAMLKLHQAIPENADFGGVVVKGKVKVEENAQKVNGFTLHGVQMTFDMDKLVERFPEELRETMKGTMKKLIGEDQKYWFGTDGTTTVQVTAKDWSAAKSLLEKYFSGKDTLSTEPGYQLTRKQLAGPANTVVVIDAGKFAYTMAQYVGEVLKNIPGAPGNAGEAKKPDGKPAYIGIMLNLEPRNGAFDLFLPADGVKQIIGVLAPMFGGLGG